MNKLKRKNTVSKLSSVNFFTKKFLIFLIGIFVSTNVLAQVTFTTTPASSPRNALGTNPADGQAIGSVPSLGARIAVLTFSSWISRSVSLIK